MPAPATIPPPTPLTPDQAPLWTRDSFAPGTWTYVLDQEETAEVIDAVTVAQARLSGRDLITDRALTVGDFPLSRVGTALRGMSAEVAGGQGFAVLRGLPVGQLTEQQNVLLLRGLATYLGPIATQSRDGQLIRHVRATGRRLGDTTVRGHQTAERLWFHTDGADAAVLLCCSAAAAGGLSRLAAAGTVHNEMLQCAPKWTAELYRPFHFHMAGGNVPGLPATFISPVFSLHQNRFSTRFVRHTLLETPKVTGVPLSAAAMAAFDLLEELGDEHSIDMELQPGDLQMVNNHTVLHSRTAYADPEPPAAPRHLLRSWISFPHYRGRRPGAVDEWLRGGLAATGAEHLRTGRMTAHTVRPGNWREDIAGRLVRLARRRPDHPAVIDSAGEVSFRTLYTAAARRAERLETQTDHGVVVVPATPTADFYIQLCAAWFAGRTPLPLPAAAPSVLVDQAVRAVARTRAGGCLPWKAVLTVDGSRQIPMVTHGESPTVSRKALALGLVPGGRALIAAPLHLNGPLEFSFRQLFLGGTVIITPSFTPQRWLRAMHGHRPDWAFLVPTQLQRVWDGASDEEIRRTCTSLRLLLHSSAPCPSALRERLGRVLSPSRVAEYYGTTVYDGTFAPYSSAEPGGAPLPGSELRVVDRHGWPVPPGSEGFIEGRSRAGLITHPADRPCPAVPVWHGVGDVGQRVGSSGRLLVTDVSAAPGRVIVAGVKVAVEDTRTVLAAHPAVDSCTVTAQPHPAFGSVLAAQVLTRDPRLTQANLRSWCARSLTSPQRPHSIDLRVSSGVPALSEPQGEGHA